MSATAALAYSTNSATIPIAHTTTLQMIAVTLKESSKNRTTNIPKMPPHSPFARRKTFPINIYLPTKIYT